MYLVCTYVRICTDFCLFAKLFLINSFYLYDSPKISPIIIFLCMVAICKKIKCTSTMPTILSMSNVIICGYSYISLAFTSACSQKKHHIMRHMKFATIHWNYSCMVYADNLAIIDIRMYATSDSQLTLVRYAV